MAKFITRRHYKLVLFSSFLLVLLAAIISTNAHHHSNPQPPASILRAACSSTRDPSLCYTNIAAESSLLPTFSSHKDVIHASLNLTISALHHSFLTIQNLYSSSSKSPNFTSRARIALHDCLEVNADTLSELHQIDTDLREYNPAKNHKTLLKYSAELQILATAAITNQDSCLDGFAHDHALRARIAGGVEHVRRMCFDALAMIKNMTDGDVGGRREEAVAVRPEWVDEKVLKGELEVEADVVVAADGSGDYRTVGEAVAAAPAKSERRYVIKIKAGRYEENVEVARKKTNVMFVGEGRDKTVITGSRNVVDGSTTFRSATLAVVGGGFLARGLRIENTAGPSKHQAVALRVNADLSAFYDCDIIGYQDTLYVHSLRQFFTNCTIQGTVDFIFGNAAVVFQYCNIQVRRPNPNQKNMVTAQSRDDPDEPTGIIFHKCRITAAPDLEPVKSSFRSFLGRPWKAYSRTVIIESEISDAIDPLGWHEWQGDFGLDTLYYAEYKNFGLRADTSNRVKWKGYTVITNASEAMQFTVGNFIEGSTWLEPTGFPYSPGL